MKQTNSIAISKEDDWQVAIDTDTGVTSQGATKAEAISNLQEAAALFNQEVDKRDIMITASNSVGIDYLKDTGEDMNSKGSGTSI